MEMTQAALKTALTQAPKRAPTQAPTNDPGPSNRPALARPFSNGLNAEALAERMARKAARLQRRHTLAEVARQYVAASGPLLGRDPGRLTPLRMWVDMLGESMLDEITTDEVAEA